MRDTGGTVGTCMFGVTFVVGVESVFRRDKLPRDDPESQLF